EPLEPDRCYRYLVEQGAVRCTAGHQHAMLGRDLLALEEDAMPDDRGLKSLRDMMRQIIRFHLGGGELRAWRVLSMAVSRRRESAS
ncbi:MAG: DNA repair protein RecO, partial [Pseudomonadota bacterium]|nr:DNA repair protein RecO [Pseudomonadota bacterium]